MWYVYHITIYAYIIYIICFAHMYMYSNFRRFHTIDADESLDLETRLKENLYE